MRGVFVLAAWLALAAPTLVAAQDATPTPQPAVAEATAGLARTDLRYFLPFTRDGLNPSLTVSGNDQGSCLFTSSAAVSRPDAWDCIGESNQIHDPCFENPFAPRDDPGELACLVSPFTTDVVLFALTAPLQREKEGGMEPSPGGGSSAVMDLTAPWALPWALELANGEQCTLLPGTVDVLAGLPVHYGCSGGGILGEPDRSQPPWTVSYLADGDVATTLVEVTVAWS